MTVWEMWALYASPILVAVGIHYAYKWLPAGIRTWIDGKKTIVIGSLGVVGTMATDIITQIQGVDLNAVLPMNSALRVGFYMSLLLILLRTLTNAPWSSK